MGNSDYCEIKSNYLAHLGKGNEIDIEKYSKTNMLAASSNNKKRGECV